VVVGGGGCVDVFCGCYCAWGVRYDTLYVDGFSVEEGGERAGVGFKRGGDMERAVWQRDKEVL